LENTGSKGNTPREKSQLHSTYPTHPTPIDVPQGLLADDLASVRRVRQVYLSSIYLAVARKVCFPVGSGRRSGDSCEARGEERKSSNRHAVIVDSEAVGCSCKFF
jgi:hypothetical protein